MKGQVVLPSPPLLWGTCGAGLHWWESSECAGRVSLCAGGRRNEVASEMGHWALRERRAVGWEPREGDEEPGGRRFLPHTGWFWAKSQLTALLLHAEQEVYPLNSTCYSQSPGCLYLAAKLHAFEHIRQQKPSVRCKPTACCFFSSGPHLLDMDMQSPASHLSCSQWQEPDLLLVSVGVELRTSCVCGAYSRSALLK